MHGARRRTPPVSFPRGVGHLEADADRGPLLALLVESDTDQGMVLEPLPVHSQAIAALVALEIRLRQLERAAAAMEDHREPQACGLVGETAVFLEGGAHLVELAALREHQVRKPS